jgi:hypothetical protein
VLFLIAAVGLVASLVMFRYFGPWAWLSLIVPAVVLFIAALFLGPVPPPDPDPRPMTGTPPAGGYRGA